MRYVKDRLKQLQTTRPKIIWILVLLRQEF